MVKRVTALGHAIAAWAALASPVLAQAYYPAQPYPAQPYPPQGYAAEGYAQQAYQQPAYPPEAYAPGAYGGADAPPPIVRPAYPPEVYNAQDGAQAQARGQVQARGSVQGQSYRGQTYQPQTYQSQSYQSQAYQSQAYEQRTERVSYLTWAGKAEDQGAARYADDRYGQPPGYSQGGPVSGGYCPSARAGERVLSCQYVPYAPPERQGQGEVVGSLYLDGGVGPDAIVGGGGGGGGPNGNSFDLASLVGTRFRGGGSGTGSGSGSGSGSATSSSSASASASANISANISIAGGFFGGFKGRGGGGKTTGGCGCAVSKPTGGMSGWGSMGGGKKK